MRNAETVLAIIHERGKQGLPLEDIYRQLYNPHLYLRAYDRLRTNKGALTPGVTGETVDGMSMRRIQRIIDALRAEQYRWTPAKRVYIPKKRTGKLRPLGLPSWSDKLLQDVMRQILEAYYEPQFSDHAHGFRPHRGCHTALTAIKQRWSGTRWFVEGDISQCFDKLDHDVLMVTLRARLHDNRFLRLVETMLAAGYLEDWRWHATYSGSPQGGVISPVLSNIYLDRLDTFVERRLLPCFNRGKKRAADSTYQKVTYALGKARKGGDGDLARALVKRRRLLPAGAPNDPHFRRLTYVRYADDFLLGFIGPRAEAEDIKARLRDFLRADLKLDLSEDKTLITHATDDVAHFLGYDVRSNHADDCLCPDGRRNVNGIIALRVPKDVVTRKCAAYMRGGKPIHRPELAHESDYSIMTRYQQEYRGVVQYYLLAHNVAALSYVCYTMHVSLLKTLACKHRAKAVAMARRYRSTTETEHGPLKCLKVVVPRDDGKKPLVAIFGGIPLRRKETATLRDTLPNVRFLTQQTDIVSRLLADVCEICGHETDCEVHHIRKLADLHKTGRREKPLWMQRMIALRRKTLVVCAPCHRAIHHGKPLDRA